MGRPKTRVVYVKVCEHCGIEFDANKKEQRFCSRQCVSDSQKGSRADTTYAKREADWADPWASGAVPPVRYDTDYYYTPDVMYGF